MISIIIPVYNMADKLNDCLASVLQQTLLQAAGNIEVIVVNDGSTDDSGEAAAGLAGKFTQRGIRFEYIVQENQGANPARNRGFAESSGEYVIFCDADVVMRPKMLEKMLKTLEANPQASYAYSSFLWGRKKFKLWSFDAARLKQMPYITTTTLIRREHFPGFDPELKRLQDWDLWLTMLENGYTGVWIDEVLFQVRTGGTMSNWLPASAYKLFPFLPQVKRYNAAVALIKKKHKIGQT